MLDFLREQSQQRRRDQDQGQGYLWMETHASPTKPFETIEDAARPDVINDDSAAVTTIPAVEVSPPVKREANDF